MKEKEILEAKAKIEEGDKITTRIDYTQLITIQYEGVLMCFEVKVIDQIGKGKKISSIERKALHSHLDMPKNAKNDIRKAIKDHYKCGTVKSCPIRINLGNMYRNKERKVLLSTLPK